MRPAETIRFLTSDYEGRLAVTRLAGFVDLPTTELGEQIRKLLGDFGQSLQRVPDGIGPYALDEIQMGLAVDAKAGVVVSAGATASITLTFRRSKGPSEPARTR